MELKQNRSLPAEKQIVTANPDIVKVFEFSFHVFKSYFIVFLNICERGTYICTASHALSLYDSSVSSR